MEVGQIGETGVHVSVITALEQGPGTELDLVPTPLLLVMEGIGRSATIIQHHEQIKSKKLIDMNRGQCVCEGMQ